MTDNRSLLLKNGRIIDPVNGREARADLLIEQDRIVSLPKKGKPKQTNIQVIDCSGKLVVPGLVDMHVHLREPGEEYKETIHSGARAAAAGGFFIDLDLVPNLAPELQDLAGLDGIQNKIHPGEPLDKDIYDLPPEELAKVPQTPGSLRESLNALEADHDYLLRGDVFTSDVIETWIEYKMAKEVQAIDLRPHPWEFALYYDI